MEKANHILEQNNTLEYQKKVCNDFSLPEKYKNKILLLIKKYSQEWLNDIEKGIIDAEIDYHIKLLKIKWEYELVKNNMLNITKNEIENDIKKLENNDFLIKKVDLNNLLFKINTNNTYKKRKEILWFSLWDSYRDIIKSNIDIKWVLENLYESNIIKDFYNIFTDNYTNFILEKNNTEKKYHDFSKNTWLDLTEEELFKIINDTIEVLYDTKNEEYNNIWFTAIFKLKNWKQIVKNIKKTDLNNKWDNLNTNKIIDTFTKYYIGHNTQQPYNWPLSFFLEKEKSGIGKISNLLRKEEKDPNFLLSEFIEKNWLPESTKILLKRLLKESLVWTVAVINIDKGNWKIESKQITYTDKSSKNKNEYSIEKNSDKLIKNLEKIIILTLNIESSWWKNIENYNWSWAEWYYQIHTKNWKIWYEKLIDEVYIDIDKKEYDKIILQNKSNKKEKVQVRTINKSSSYKTAIKYLIKNNSKFVNKNQYLKAPSIWNRIIDVNKKEIQWISWPMDLTAEEQTNLWLIDLFGRISDNRKSYLANMLIWSQSDAKEFYKKIQHTVPDEKTIKLMEYYMKDLYNMENLINN